MAFSINTNIGALQAYNALAKVNAQTEKAQLRLSTLKKINSVADDTSGYNVGKQLEAQTLVQKAQLNNIASAKNYLSTAESALQQIADKLNQIKAKQIDAKDPLKDSNAIANDIKTLAEEIESILKSTNINGTQLLASTDGATALAGDTFDVGGSTFTIDFAQDTYLKVGDLSTAISGLKTDKNTDIEDVSTNVRNALLRIGNLRQTLDSREEYLTAAIANNTATISNIFDADVAMEQLNATKGQIGAQIATAMLAQMNTAPQQVLNLFR
ncbi:MAG: flagellin [Melioribacteraceae bacterium]